MRSALPLALASAALAALAALPAAAGDHGHSTEASSSRRFESCDSIHVRFDDSETLRGEQVLEVAGAEIDVAAPENGGVRVQGSSRKGIRVLACKAVAEGGSLDAIVASVEGNRLVVRGPEEERWAVHLVVDVPRDARVSVSAQNGPVSILDVDGTVRVSAQNGPVSAVRAVGTLTVDAVNGPVSLVDAAGDVKVDAQNGPLSVKLAPGGWKGAGLEGHTQNGPLSLRMPDGYDSGVEVRMSRRAPLACSVEPCAGAGRSVEDGIRTVALGSGLPSVRLGTINGPVSIKPRA